MTLSRIAMRGEGWRSARHRGMSLIMRHGWFEPGFLRGT